MRENLAEDNHYLPKMLKISFNFTNTIPIIILVGSSCALPLPDKVKLRSVSVWTGLAAGMVE
jgi:hypothetical protein